MHQRQLLITCTTKQPSHQRPNKYETKGPDHFIQTWHRCVSPGQQHFLPEIFASLYLSASILSSRWSLTVNNLNKQKTPRSAHRKQRYTRCGVIKSRREFVQSLIAPPTLLFPPCFVSYDCRFLALNQKDAPRHPALSSSLTPTGTELRPPGAAAAAEAAAAAGVPESFAKVTGPEKLTASFRCHAGHHPAERSAGIPSLVQSPARVWLSKALAGQLIVAAGHL